MSIRVLNLCKSKAKRSYSCLQPLIGHGGQLYFAEFVRRGERRELDEMDARKTFGACRRQDSRESRSAFLKSNVNGQKIERIMMGMTVVVGNQ